MMTKRQRGLLLLGICIVFATATTVCNQVASSRVDRLVGEKEMSVRTALNALGSSSQTGIDPDSSILVRYGLYSVSRGKEPGAVVVTGEVRWAWEYRCVVGQRQAGGAVDLRVVSSTCSSVAPTNAFPNR